MNYNDPATIKSHHVATIKFCITWRFLRKLTSPKKGKLHSEVEKTITGIIYSSCFSTENFPPPSCYLRNLSFLYILFFFFYKNLLLSSLCLQWTRVFLYCLLLCCLIFHSAEHSLRESRNVFVKKLREKLGRFYLKLFAFYF